MSSNSLSCALFCDLLSFLLCTDWVSASIVLSWTLCSSPRELHKAVAALKIEFSLLCSFLALLSSCCGYGHGYGDQASRLRMRNCSLCRHRVFVELLACPRFNERITMWRIWHSATRILEKDLWLDGYNSSISMAVFSMTMWCCYVFMAVPWSDVSAFLFSREGLSCSIF